MLQENIDWVIGDWGKQTICTMSGLTVSKRGKTSFIAIQSEGDGDAGGRYGWPFVYSRLQRRRVGPARPAEAVRVRHGRTPCYGAITSPLDRWPPKTHEAHPSVDCQPRPTAGLMPFMNSDAYCRILRANWTTPGGQEGAVFSGVEQTRWRRTTAHLLHARAAFMTLTDSTVHWR